VHLTATKIQLDYLQRLADATLTAKQPENYRRAIRTRVPMVEAEIARLKAYANCKPETVVATRVMATVAAWQATVDYCLSV